MLLMLPDSKVVVAMLANILVDFGETDAQRIGAFFITANRHCCVRRGRTRTKRPVGDRWAYRP
jgi:hypothetical protein